MKFFMAYSRADKDYAASLAAEIERKGGSVCYDESASEPGAEWRGELRELLNNSGAAILVLPREGASGANNAIFEAGAAKALGKKVFVVARGGADRELPSSIADFAIFDAENKPIQEIAGALVQYAA